MSYADAAARLFDDGHACSQAVLIPFAEDFGISREDAARMAAGFGGGMRLDGKCGAVTGAIMVLGIAFGMNRCDTGEKRTPVSDATIEFAKRYQEAVGSLDCRGILECDVRTQEGRDEASAKGLYDTRCVDAVRESVRILEELIAGR